MNLNLQLHPIYMWRGFRTQAHNVQQTYCKSQRKQACLLETIASHIKKWGSDCFASTYTLVKEYNEAAPRYSVDPISRRTLFNLLDQLEAQNFIERSYSYIKETMQTKRHLTLNFEAVGRVFKAAFNWAVSTAAAAVARENLHSGGSDQENPDEASADKALEQTEEKQTCTLITKDLKDKKNKGTPPQTFFEKFFKESAQEVQSLQQAARSGKITANGAKKLIKIHNQYGYPLAEKFKKFLNYVILKGSKKKSPPDPRQMAPKPQKTETKKSPIDGKEFGSAHCRDAAYLAPPDDHHVKLGLAEYYRDEIGRVHVRWLDKKQIEQAATTTAVSDSNTKNFNQHIDATQPTLDKTNIEHGKTDPNLEDTVTKNLSHAPWTSPDDVHVKLGQAEYYRDEIGRIHIRWLDKNKIEQAAAAIGDESLQTKNEPTLIDNYFLQKHLQKIRKLIS